MWVLLTIDFLEHLPHSFDVIVVKKPSLRILLVFFKWYTEGIGDIDSLAMVLTEKHAYYAFVG